MGIKHLKQTVAGICLAACVVAGLAATTVNAQTQSDSGAGGGAAQVAYAGDTQTASAGDIQTLADGTTIFDQVEINPSNKISNVGAINGGGRIFATGLSQYADPDSGMLTLYLPGEEDMKSSKSYFSLLTGGISSSGSSGNGIIQLPSFTNYSITVIGWYNIDTGEYIDVSGVSGGVETTVDMHEQNVFYCDYIASTYDFGTSTDSNLADTVSTSDFVSMHLFDYNEMFNLYSTSLERFLNADKNDEWTENWHDSGKLHDTPNASNQVYDSLDDDDFNSRGAIINNSLLLRNAGANSLLYVVEPDVQNGGVYDTFQDVEEVWDITSPDYADNNLLNMLFNPDTDAIGVTDVGDADYLFSYDDTTGVYSYSSKTNGVAYNQTDERFYVYTSPESYYASKGSDSSSLTRGLFSPFTAGKARTNADKATNNWWFGMDMSVDFTLPDTTAASGSGNVGADGEDMFFTVSATDDAIVFVDDTLVLSMGGSHVDTTPTNNAPANTDIKSMHTGTGTINFATGEYEYYIEDNKDESYVSGTIDLDAGNHTLRVYLLQRNGVASDFEASFNIHDDFEHFNGAVVWDDTNDQDGVRPDSVTVNLMNGNTVERTQTVSADDDWTFDFYAEPSAGDYSISQESVDGYDTVVAGSIENGYTITNTHEPEQTEVSGTITWDDASNQDGKRPNFVTVQLFGQDEGGSTLSMQTVDVHAPTDDSDVWTWTITDLDKNAAGYEINYAVIYDGVDLGVYDQENSGFDVVYSYMPETTTVSGSKTWFDDDDADELRPENITIELWANDVAIDKVTVGAVEGWSWEFADLPV